MKSIRSAKNRKVMLAVVVATVIGGNVILRRDRPAAVAPSPAAGSATSRISENAVPDLLSDAIAPQKYINGGTRFRSPGPEGLSGEEWLAIREQIEDSEYAFELTEERTEAHAANGSQRIKASIGTEGIEVTPYASLGAEPAWNWRLRPTDLSIGSKSLRVRSATEVTTSGRRAEVRRNGLTEWYENRTVGIEQGFTVDKPSSASVASDGRLKLSFECETSLTARPASATAIHWEDASGETVLRYSGLFAYDAESNRVPAVIEISPEFPQRLAIALNTKGAVFPITIDPLIATTEQRLEPDSVPAEPHFGFAVAMQGDVCVVGSPSDDPSAANPVRGDGFVYTFRKNPSGAWHPASRIADQESNSNRAFGSAVDLSGHTLVVGSPAFANPGAPPPTSAVGVYIFRLNPGPQFGVATQIAQLSDPDGPSRASGFGRSVAISGTGKYVAVGSPGYSLTATQTGGRVSIYRQQTDGSYETAPSPNHDSWGGQVAAGWGTSLSFDKTRDSWLAVGAPGFDQPGFLDAGSSAVLMLHGGGFSAAPVVPKSPGYLANGHFGASVSVFSGDLAVGHPGATVPVLNTDGTAQMNPAGAVHLFGFQDQWFEEDVIQAPDPQSSEFGARLSLDGELLVIDSNARSYGYTFSGPEWVLTFSYPDFPTVPAPSFPPVVSGDRVLFGDTGEIFRLSGNGWNHFEPTPLTQAAPGERRGATFAATRDYMLAGSPFFSAPGKDHRGLVSVITFTASGQSSMTPLGTNAPAGAELGASVATDGKRIAVGAPGFNGGTGLASIYERNGSGSWIEINGVQNPDSSAGAGDRFGSAISINGNRMVVGAALDGEYGFWAGRAWVFERDANGNWGNHVELKPVDPLAPFDLFGWAVEINGDRIVVTEPGDDDAGSGAGAFHVFEWSQGFWRSASKITPDPNDVPAGVEVNLGFSLALDGDRIAVGAPAPIISPGSGPGSVSVFARMAGGAGNWGQIARIVPAEGANDDEFGLMVRWHDDELFVGSGQTDTIHMFRSANGGNNWIERSSIRNPYEATDAGFGHAFAIMRDVLATGIPFAHQEAGELVFFRRPGGWNPDPVYDGSDTNGFGSSLAVDGDTAVIGADRYTLPGATGIEHGGAYVLTRDEGGRWSVSTNVLSAGQPWAGARFGAAVAIERDRIMVGAPFHGFTGAAWEFIRAHDGQWIRENLPNIPNLAAHNSQFGASVDIDGRLAVVGAPFEGDGTAFVFRFEIKQITGATDSQLEKKITPPAGPAQNKGARFGAAISVDGETIAIGAPGYDLPSTTDGGAVFLYERSRGGTRNWGASKTLAGLPSLIPPEFGWALDLSGDWLLVGAPQYQPPASIANGPTGVAYLFRYDHGGAGNWGREQSLLASERGIGARFGHAVAVADEWIAVGAPGRKWSDGRPSGAVELFLFGGRAGASVAHAMQFVSPSHSGLGSSLALGGRTLLAGDDILQPGWTSVDIFSLMNHRERWGFDFFQQDVFDLALESTLWGDEADKDRDGLTTILEYLLGSSPHLKDPTPFYPTIVAGSSAVGDCLRLRYPKARWASGSEYELVPEWSFDLKTWYRSGEGPPGAEKIIEQIVASEGGPWDNWIVDACLPLKNDEYEAFMRLVASKNNAP